ncbi:hypothetical protein [Natrinema limicola]|nr:hypothetical protein [Natrinema limicola]
MSELATPYPVTREAVLFGTGFRAALGLGIGSGTIERLVTRPTLETIERT